MVNYSIYFCFQDMILSTMEMLKWMIIVRISGHCCLLNGWIILSSSTFIFHHHWVTVDCFYLFISYLYFILKVMFNQCFISFINSGLFYRWSCGFKSENSAKKWKWHLATMKPSLPTIPVSFRYQLSKTMWRPCWRSFFELIWKCCILLHVRCYMAANIVEWIVEDSGLQNKLSVVWFFNFQVLLASGISSLLV